MSIPNTSDLTAAFSNLALHLQSPKPTPDQCIAHLKLLEAFHQLREDVATTDGLFGITDSLVPAHGLLETQRIDALRKIREKRWAVYVASAAVRFERWWERSVEPGAVMIRQNQLDVGKSLGVEGNGEKSWSFSKDDLPPLGMSRILFLLALTSAEHGRRHHGLAFVYAKPKMLSGGLSKVWEDGFLEFGISLGGYRLMH
jgi:hypothetical protein